VSADGEREEGKTWSGRRTTGSLTPETGSDAGFRDGSIELQNLEP
jgi:hypothetical protein